VSVSAGVIFASAGFLSVIIRTSAKLACVSLAMKSSLNKLLIACHWTDDKPICHMTTIKYVVRESAERKPGTIIGDAWVTDNAKAPVRIQFRNGWDKETEKEIPVTHAIPGRAKATIVLRAPRKDKAGNLLPTTSKTGKLLPNAVVILDTEA
jgi:hypothetical protein